MRQHDWSRATRRAVGVVAVAFGATLLPSAAVVAAQANEAVAPPSSASAHGSGHGRTRITGFDDDRVSVALGRKVSDQVVVLPRARRTVLVQARTPGSSQFVTQSRGHSTAAGRFRADYTPTSAGTWAFRLLVLPSAKRGPATSHTRLVRVTDVSAPRAVTELQVSGISLDGATLSWMNPTDDDCTGVTIRRAVGATAPASQVDGTAVADTGRSIQTFTDKALAPNTTYSYALFAHDSSGNFSRATVVTLRTGRFGVSHLVAAPVTRTTVTLAWTNPTDDAFAGVIIRRAEGPTPPASATEGSAVGDDVASPGDNITDDHLRPGTTYSYAVFAHDATDHVAAAVTATVTTRGNGVSAVLSVNPLPSVHTGDRVTVDTQVAIDASQSLPTVGTDFVAWEISYGDHITDSLNGRLTTVDVLNTKHTFANAGAHVVTLTVTDSAGHTASATLMVDVFDAPEVSLRTSSSSSEAGVTVPFEIKSETPRDTAITSYRMEVAGDDSFFLDGDSAPPPSQDITFASGQLHRRPHRDQRRWRHRNLRPGRPGGAVMSGPDSGRGPHQRGPRSLPTGPTARVNHAEPGPTRRRTILMARSSHSHRTSVVSGALALLLGAGLTAALATPAVSAPASHRAHRAPTSLRGLSTAPVTVEVNGLVTDDVSVRHRAHRPVYVQAQQPGSKAFVTVASRSGFSTRSGTFRAVYQPTTAGTWRFRLLLPATARATRLVSASRAITATAPTTPTPTPTQGAVTTAALSLNGSKGAIAKQTVNLSESFVISGTHAGAGLTLLSGTLEYGDRTPAETFHGDARGWTPREHQYAHPGPVTATWTVLDSAGKSVSSSVDITVFAQPTVTLSRVTAGMVEKNKPVRFIITATTPEGTEFTHFDTFSSSNGTTFDNVVSGDRRPSEALTLTFPTPGTYTVYVDVDNDAGGFAEYAVKVPVIDGPKN